ncbi:short-chain dehydrogenase-like protein [Aspergillus sclerotioniger CBS 115572]|uniref:Short-chain dehydrogenase-like protein n=1 Tax=Aspergillus sclerotioniger CBS 115572 TaxID=1450535 RepID=A0A317VTH0_9EURO|nr:short-chain dehydrogenase-like protein [Aspergillus sclerotioniger CBS 115572]PWY75230.1 short-chain dehydrogenase-like protein [Aspergillus sclerotioniger CBS 115572]
MSVHEVTSHGTPKASDLALGFRPGSQLGLAIAREVASYIDTGAGRGLGLQFVKHLSERSLVRYLSSLRQSAGRGHTAAGHLVQVRITVMRLYTTDRESILIALNQIKKSLSGKALDILTKNAAIMDSSLDGVVSMDNLRRAFEVNVEAVHDATAACLPQLREGTQRKVFNLSSDVGSITLGRRLIDLPFPTYNIVKIALNALTVQYALEFEKEGFTFFAVSPGWFRTNMVTDIADLDVSTGASTELDVLSCLGAHINGKFLNVHVPGWEQAEGLHQYDGGELP